MGVRSVPRGTGRASRPCPPPHRGGGGAPAGAAGSVCIPSRVGRTGDIPWPSAIESGLPRRCRSRRRSDRRRVGGHPRSRFLASYPPRPRVLSLAPMSFTAHSFHRNPDRRHSDRRSGAATVRFRRGLGMRAEIVPTGVSRDRLPMRTRTRRSKVLLLALTIVTVAASLVAVNRTGEGPPPLAPLESEREAYTDLAHAALDAGEVVWIRNGSQLPSDIRATIWQLGIRSVESYAEPREVRIQGTSRHEPFYVYRTGDLPREKWGWDDLGGGWYRAR